VLNSYHGQFDQRANALEECLQILAEGNRPTAKSAKIYIMQGNLKEEDKEKIKKYIVMIMTIGKIYDIVIESKSQSQIK